MVHDYIKMSCLCRFQFFIVPFIHNKMKKIVNKIIKSFVFLQMSVGRLEVFQFDRLSAKWIFELSFGMNIGIIPLQFRNCFLSQHLQMLNRDIQFFAAI